MSLASHPADAAIAANPATPSEIVVVGEHLPGSIKTHIQPLAKLDAKAIQALGAANLSDLVKALGPLAKSADGSDPIFVLNGRRPSGQDEIFTLPPEAFERIEIMPDPVAMQFGFPPTRRVLNFITKKRFRAIDVQTNDGTSINGGATNRSATVSLTRIRNESRLSLSGTYSRRSALHQSDRRLLLDNQNPYDKTGNITGIAGSEIDPALSAIVGSVVTIAGLPDDPGTRSALSGYGVTAGRGRTTDLGPYRSLLPGDEDWKTSATIARPIGHASLSLNLSVEHKRNWSLQGFGLWDADRSS
jgi:outer membrane receptor protein involved in Fe transport